MSAVMDAEKCPACGSCGFPLKSAEDHALGDPSIPYCRSCTDSHGRLLPYEAILQANEDYFVESQDLDRGAAHRMAQELLSRMPAWRDRQMHA